MSGHEDCLNLTERLQNHRSRLQALLQSQAHFGIAATPAYITTDMRAARREIAQLKERLRQVGCPVADEQDDHDPQAIRDLDEDESAGIEEFEQDPRYQHFYATPSLQQMLDQVLREPGYHLIEGPRGYGKTALVRELWRRWEDRQQPRLAYCFSHEAQRTQLASALRALTRQAQSLSDMPELRPGTVARPSTFQALLRAYGSGAGLVLFLDSLDECGSAERPLIMQLLPESLAPGVTVVITMRPVQQHPIMQALPLSHPLRAVTVAVPKAGAVRHQIGTLSQSEIHYLLVKLGQPALPSLVKRIAERSRGLLMAAIPYIEQPALLDDPKHSVLPIDEYDRRGLEQCLGQAAPELQPLLPSLLATLAVAEGGLTPADLEQILEQSSSTLASARRHIANFHYVSLNGELILERPVQDYLRRNELIEAQLPAAQTRLQEWVIGFVPTTPLTQIPTYALHHATAYLAFRPDLIMQLGRPDWFRELEQRCGARSRCTEAVERTINLLEQAFTGRPGDPAIINLILCAIVRASLRATLLPELVAQLVRLGLWSEAMAQDYAENYHAEANRTVLLELLAQPERHLNLPPGTPVAETAALLRHCVNLPPAARQAALLAWQRNSEHEGGNVDIQADHDLFARLVAALHEPPVEPGPPALPSTFSRLLDEISHYQLPQTGPMSDPGFIDLLAELADTWCQLRPREQHTFWLQPILRTLANFPRADLIEALELLAPAIRTLFPTSIPALRADLVQLSQALIPS